MSVSAGTYRPDIDGLRAIAVLGVIAFHAGLAPRGGYVGVDVFFVISGYLITGLIARDLDRGTFAMRDFWKRRILRIWPASIAMVFAVLLMATAVMIPRDLSQTSADAISQIFMTANITFWRSADYFAIDSEMRPLLHCWSLAVEEQFYLFVPIVLAAFWKRGPLFVYVLISAAAATSFALCIGLLKSHPQATFFLLPTRAWELAMGSLLALLPAAGVQLGARREILAALGAGLISYCMLTYTAYTPFPGVATLPVCLGTCMLLVTPTSTVNRLLSAAPLRAIGLVSYSLYLWHWPILAFARYLEGVDLSTQTTVFALVCTAVAGVISWRFMEQPFRAKAPQLTFQRTATVAAAVLATVTVVALVPLVSAGLPQRFSDQAMRYLTPRGWRPLGFPDGRMTPLGSPDPQGDVRLLLVGDSHAGAVSRALHEVAIENGVSGWVARRTGRLGCPIPNLDLGTDAEWLENTIRRALELGATDVVLCSRWSFHLHNAVRSRCGGWPMIDCESEVLGSIAGSLAALDEAVRRAGGRVWFLSEVPGAPDQRAAVVRFSLLGEPLPASGVSREAHYHNQRSVAWILEAAAFDPERVCDLADPWFTEDGERAAISDERGWLYWDSNHINTEGSTIVLGQLAKLVLQIKEAQKSMSLSTLPN